MSLSSLSSLPPQITIGKDTYVYEFCNVYQKAFYKLIIENIAALERLSERRGKIDPKDQQAQKLANIELYKAAGVLEYFQKRMDAFGRLKPEAAPDVDNLYIPIA